MNRRLRNSLAIGSVLLAAAAIAVWSRIDSLAREVRRETAILDASRPLTDDSPTAARLLAELAEQLESCSPEELHAGVPWKWDPHFDRALRQELTDLGPYFEAVDACMANPAMTSMITQRGRTDARCSLMASRQRTNVLCARAILHARDGESVSAARRLSQALDLMTVDAGPSGVGLMLNVCSEGIVLSALRQIVITEGTDAVVLATELDEELRRITEPARLMDALRSDTLATVVWPRPWAEGADKWTTGWDTLARAPGWFDELRACELMAQRDGVPDPKCIDVKSELDLRVLGRSLAGQFVTQFRRAQLARLALRTAAFRAENGSWPDSLGSVAPDLLAASDLAGAVAYAVDGPEARLLADVGSSYPATDVWALR